MLYWKHWSIWDKCYSNNHYLQMGQICQKVLFVSIFGFHPIFDFLLTWHLFHGDIQRWAIFDLINNYKSILPEYLFHYFSLWTYLNEKLKRLKRLLVWILECFGHSGFSVLRSFGYLWFYRFFLNLLDYWALYLLSNPIFQALLLFENFR